ncbi:uncharacterized protein LOC116422685 [Sarcophilus harrisii]|uniref:uncharacterized protein LOC116422685 n=1 Tax=Sarcophilus harrisii TaxID=9305 RepID=UPI001301B3DE|nr:uncharacterized protein LOC116422685 [Sarcophilus harrisii]
MALGTRDCISAWATWEESVSSRELAAGPGPPSPLTSPGSLLPVSARTVCRGGHNEPPEPAGHQWRNAGSRPLRLRTRNLVPGLQFPASRRAGGAQGGAAWARTSARGGLARYRKSCARRVLPAFPFCAYALPASRGSSGFPGFRDPPPAFGLLIPSRRARGRGLGACSCPPGGHNLAPGDTALQMGRRGSKRGSPQKPGRASCRRGEPPSASSYLHSFCRESRTKGGMFERPCKGGIPADLCFLEVEDVTCCSFSIVFLFLSFLPSFLPFLLLRQLGLSDFLYS